MPNSAKILRLSVSFPAIPPMPGCAKCQSRFLIWWALGTSFWMRDAQETTIPLGTRRTKNSTRRSEITHATPHESESEMASLSSSCCLAWTTTENGLPDGSPFSVTLRIPRAAPTLHGVSELISPGGRPLPRQGRGGPPGRGDAPGPASGGVCAGCPPGVPESTRDRPPTSSSRDGRGRSARG